MRQIKPAQPAFGYIIINIYEVKDLDNRRVLRRELVGSDWLLGNGSMSNCPYVTEEVNCSVKIFEDLVARVAPFSQASKSRVF